LQDKIKNLHLYDCLRANKSTSAWGVEARTPFLDADFLEGADAADVEDAEIGRFEPFLAEVARALLKRVEKIDAELGRLRLKFEEAGAGEGAFAAGLVGREAHDAAAAAGEDADVGPDEAGELLDEAGDARGVGGVEADGGTVEGEDGGLLEFAGELLADKEAVVFFVDVGVELFGGLVIPVDADADGVERVEARVALLERK
jgi:hypothetical protein